VQNAPRGQAHVVDTAADREELDAWEAVADRDGTSLTIVLDEQGLRRTGR
jgi:hypothetical protein